MIVHQHGAWLIPCVLAASSPFSKILLTEVISGYGDHQERLAQIPDPPSSDNMFRIGEFAKDFIARDDVREVQIRGHADRVWSHGTQDRADEDRVSQNRADDVWNALEKALTGIPGGVPMLMKIAAGLIGLIVVGVGSRLLLTTKREEGARNRRVELQLWATRSIPI